MAKYVSLKKSSKGKLREKGRFEVSLPLTLISKFDSYCLKRGLSRTQVIENLINSTLKKN